ncbi:MAG TPA: alpha/beta fold hydrolase [Acetobacteraceae bacterium]|nr:alpha/beta fold hydrolase [Acetobacteraceae bacterium]
MILHARSQGSGPPVALLHGLFGSGRNLGAIQRALASHFRAIALDLRNHGDSPHAASMSYPEMAADVAATLGALGALPAAVLGHSMGGKVAMRLALDRPDAVGRLIIADIAPVPNPPRFAAIAEAMRALRPGLSRAAADAALRSAVPDAGLRAFLLLNWRAEGWRIGLDNIIANLAAIEGWDAPAGARYEGPVLFVTGARSDYVRPEHRPAIRALFPAARFVAIKDAGHWLHADNQAAMIAVVEAFLHAPPRDGGNTR